MVILYLEPLVILIPTWDPADLKKREILGIMCCCGTHHELSLGQALGWDGAEDPGLMAALLSDLLALPGQLPVFGGAQLC